MTKIVEQDFKNTKQQLEDLQKFLSREKNDKYTFVVNIRSGWSDYGEKSVKLSGEFMNRTIKRATDKFRKVNNRSDVQGTITVYLKISDNVRYYIPGKFYEEYATKCKKRICD